MATTTATGGGAADVRDVNVSIGASRRAIVRIDGSVLAHRPNDNDNIIDDECDEGVRTGRRGGCDDVDAAAQRVYDLAICSRRADASGTETEAIISMTIGS